MATSFKNFLNSDSTQTRTLLHEAIPVTGSIVSGTYITNTETNIKNYAHDMFQSVYDYPFLSSSANHIFDITMGFSASSGLSGGVGSTSGQGPAVQQQKKINLYNQMAQLLMGHTTGGAIRGFDRDGDITGGSEGLSEVFFVSFARLLSKDEIKKGSFNMTLYTGSVPAGGEVTLPTSEPTGALTIGDYGATNAYKVNSPAGEYGLLLTSSTSDTNLGVGLVFYQAGIAVITASVFSGNPCWSGVDADSWLGRSISSADPPYPTGAAGDFSPAVVQTYFGSALTSSQTVALAMISQSISGACDGFRNRLKSVSFNNTTELNSTIYFCRANHNEFNYSANPTYVDASKIVVKNSTTDLPVSYITTVGLYSADNELLAMAKLSEPLKKDPNTELTLRVRLDY